MPDEHARLSPSAAHRWLRCRASVRLCETIEERRDSEFAAEGTVAHHVREECLIWGFDPEDFIGDEIEADGFTFTVDADMAENLRPGIERIRSLPGAKVVEMRVSAETWLKDCWGTMDFGCYYEAEPGHVVIMLDDLKYGIGVPVSPEDNEQQMIYGLSFWDNVVEPLYPDAEKVTFKLNLDQPRNGLGGGEWETTLEEMSYFATTLSAYDPDDPDNEFTPGEKQCLFCPAKANCRARAEWVFETMGARFDDVEDGEVALPKREDLTPAQRAAIARHKPEIEKFLKAIYARVLDDAIAGDETPGLKAVVGRPGNRAWANEPEVMDELDLLLGAKAYHPRKLISPTQAEELLSPDAYKALMHLVTRSEGRPVLTDEADEKEAITISVADKFDDTDEPG